MRFIFTSTTTAISGQGDPISQSENGLETGRFYPGYDETFTYKLSGPTDFFGRFGVGDFTASGVNEEPTHKLDVIGNGRFRYLPDSLYIADSTVFRYVMVDSLGVLRWSSGIGFGGACDDTLNAILNFDSKVGLNDNNFYFDGQGGSNNKVGVGYDCGNPLIGKLSVLQNNDNGIGVFSQAGSSGNNVGGLFRVHSGANNTGVNSHANGGANAIGGDFNATAGGFNIGVRGFASGGLSYGVYGEAQPAVIPNYAGYFNGDVFIANSYGPSDQILKSNIEDLNNAMAIISQLQPKTFEYNQASFPSMSLQSGNQFGLIAQDIQNILPELVNNSVHPPVFDSLGNQVHPAVNFLSLEYTELIPILIAGTKEQQTQIDSLATANDSLQSQINDLNSRLTLLENCLSNILPALCQVNAASIQSTPQEVQEELRSVIDVNLSDKNTIILNQNVPNPFAERTSISFNIPETVLKAQMHFYDGTGKLIQSVEITDRGQGQLNVFASDLSSGVYTYSLVADGKVVATKRMVKE